MHMMRAAIGAALAAVVALGAVAPAAAVTPAEKCESDKVKTAGKYAFCRMQADAKAIKQGAAPDYGKCDAKYAQKWGLVESKGGGACPVNGDEAAIQTQAAECTDELAAAIGGSPPAGCPADLAQCQGDLGACGGDLSTCTVDLGTCTGDLGDCQTGLSQTQSDLTACTGDLGDCTSDLGDCTSGLADCTTALGACPADLAACQAEPKGQPVRTGQTQCWDAGGFLIACAGTGQDGEFQHGLVMSFTDNLDGTITDNSTGLMWEKLSDDGSVHDKDATYTWTTAVTTKIATLNSGGGFAGYTDWRLPNVNELQSLVSYGTFLPSVHAAFNTGCLPACTVTTCSCTPSAQHWSATTTVFPTLAWGVSFGAGGTGSMGKTANQSVRAVRGGS